MRPGSVLRVHEGPGFVVPGTGCNSSTRPARASTRWMHVHRWKGGWLVITTWRIHAQIVDRNRWHFLLSLSLALSQ